MHLHQVLRVAFAVVVLVYGREQRSRVHHPPGLLGQHGKQTELRRCQRHGATFDRYLVLLEIDDQVANHRAVGVAAAHGLRTSQQGAHTGQEDRRIDPGDNGVVGAGVERRNEIALARHHDHERRILEARCDPAGTDCAGGILLRHHNKPG